MDPASDYICDADGTQLVSAWYRLEEMTSAWTDIAARSNLGTAALPHRNATSRKKDGAIWTDAAIGAVREIYAEDFTRFGYADDAPPASSGKA